eukprot:gene31149-37646_t
MSDIEVIELGEDGSFDISTSPVKQPRVEDVDYMSYDWEKAETEERVSLIESLKANEFATYRDGNNFVMVVRLSGDDKVQSVGHNDKNVFVHTTAGSLVKVPLPDDVAVEEDTMQCKYYQDFVTLQFLGK